MRPRSRAISARRSCSSSAERLMMRASSPSSSSRLTRMRAARLPLASWRAVSMISPSDRPRPRESSSDTSPLAASATRPASAALRQSARPCASIRSMPRLSRATPTTPPARRIGTAAYSSRTPDRRARALGPRDLAGEGAHHLGAAAVVLDGRELGAGQGRVREHAPVRADDRHARVHLAGRRVDQAVELAARRAASQGVLDDARHQAGLGGQAGEGVVARAPLERRARDEQQHAEHDGGRHHRRHHHAPAQGQPASHSSLPRAKR